MRKIFYTLFVLTLTTLSVSAQEASKVSGAIKDGAGKALSSVTVSLLKAKDSALAKVAVSDKEGYYEFTKMPQGRYMISYSSVGYDLKTSDVFELNGSEIKMPAIVLTEAAKSLSGVTVQSRRQLIETRIDRMVVNVDASPTNAGNSALEVLEKSPGVTVDRDGNISLKGKQGVIVLMDGKPSYLSGADLANLLRNMPSSQLDQIEIMTQPSAKYDASGNSGIINFKMKKNTQMGMNGSVNVSYVQGRYPKSPNSFNYNYRNGNINFFSNINYSYWSGFSDLELIRKFKDASGMDTAIFSQESNQRFSGNNIGARFGLDYTVNTKTSVGIMLNGTYNPRTHRGHTLTTVTNENGVIDFFNEARNTSKDPWKNMGVNLNFRHKLNKPGSEITADLDHVRYSSRSNITSSNFSFDAAMNPKETPYLLTGLLPQDISIYSGKVDYVLPLAKEAKFEAGLKSSLVSTDNNAPYQFFNAATNQWEVDPLTDHFKYEENINAAYVNVSRQFKKWGVQTGLRFEHTHSEGNQVLKNQLYPRDYKQLFPTAYLSYAADDNNKLALSYGRRIERPNYQDMNPFVRFLDQYTFQQGNPYLTPQFTNHVELSHNFKGALNTTVNYTYTNDIINDILKQNDTTKVTFQIKENVATRRNIGLASSYNAPITKWWSTSLYAIVFNNHFEGIVNGKELEADITSFMANMSQRFTFKKGWAAEITGFYRSRAQEGGLIIADPMGVVSFGASKQILKNKGTLKLNVSDPFWIQRFRGSTQFDNMDVQIKSQWDNRRVGLSFSYRFSKGQNIQQRRRSGSALEEQNRIGGGNQQ